MQYLSSPTRSLLALCLVCGLVVLAGVHPAFAQTCDVYVDTNASGTGNGSQNSPYTDLQDGLDDATSSDVVCVAEGTYNPPKKNTPFSMTGGSTLLGGYPTGFSSTTQDVDANPTILDGANVQQGGATAKRVLTLGSFSGTTVIDGLTIKNGDGNAGAGFSPGGWFTDTLTFRDVVFAGNDAGNNDGGAVQLRGGGTANFENVDFRNNLSGNGGALYAGTSFTVVFDNSTFVGNESTGGGGAVKTEGGTIEMEGVLFSGNLASGNGGAFYFDYPDGGSLVNVTLTGNQAQGGGGGIYVGTNNQITFDNSIIWNNGADSGADQVGIDYGGSNLLYRYSDIQGSGGSGAWDSSYGTDGGNNIALNPIFLSPKQPSAAPTTAGDYRLGARSPVVDAGDDGAVTLSNDLDGENRIQDGTVDMGPYEGSAPLPDPTILYVDKNTGSDGNGGTSWSDAVATLQAALSQASSNTEIWVADGVYYTDSGPNVSDGDETVSFELKDRVSIYGGFAGNESSRSERNPDANVVVLSGDIDQDDNTSSDGVVTKPSNIRGTNAYHVVSGSGVSSQTVVDGVTITAGLADNQRGQDLMSEEAGGGVYVDNGSPNLSDVRIVGNQAKLDGGGVASYGGGGPVISESVIESNESARNGGGIYNADGSGLRVRLVTLRSNTAAEKGGGLYNEGSNMRLTSVVVEGNEATSGTSRGGGIATLDSKGSVLTNLRVVGNRAAAGGGLYNHDNSAPRSTTTVGTSTFSGNYATNGSYPHGGAIFTKNEPIELQNSIVWGNGPDHIEDETSFTQNATLIEGGLGGALNQDPKFISDPTIARSGPTTDGDLQLQPGSPAADAGDKTLLPSDVSDIDDDGDTNEQLPLDLAGGTRVRDGEVDMGAYEGTSAILTVEGTYGADGTDAGWRDVGVPVQRALLSDVVNGEGTPIRDLTPNVFIWEDDASGPHGGAWKQISNSDAVPGGKGFTVYLGDKNSTAIDPSFTFDVGSTFSPPGDQDVVVGNQQDPDGNSLPADDPMSTDSEFHFLANPYAVPYDLIEVDLVGSGFQSTAHFWNAEDGTYNLIDVTLSFNKTGITSWQGFHIERTNVGEGATKLRFPKEGRLPSPSNTNEFFGSKEASSKTSPVHALKFQLVSRNAEGNVITQDRAANLVFRPNASTGWDPYDATKWTPLSRSYAVVGPVGLNRDSTRTMKAQESRPLSDKEVVEVPLGIKTQNVSGDLTLSLEDQINVPDRWDITLVDTKGTQDPSDDEHKDLAINGAGYTFGTEQSSKTAPRKPSQGSKNKPVLPKPKPLEWSPQPESRPATNTGVSKKKGSANSRGRFVLRINRNTNALPVELSNFDATLYAKTALLEWSTSSEADNSGFYIEHQRLVEGDSVIASEKWSRLDFVEGAGTSRETRHYRYRAQNLNYGRHAFRLRQVDRSGEVHYTEPITVETTIDEPIVLTGPNPNPVRQSAELNMTVNRGQRVTVHLYDVLGRRVRTIFDTSLRAQNTHRIQVETTDLSSGTYFLRVNGESFRRTSRMTVVK